MVFPSLLGLPRASKLSTKVTFIVINWQQNYVLCVHIQGNGDKPFPCIPTQTIYSPYQSIWAAGSASPGLMTGAKGQGDLKLFKPAQLGFLQIQGAVYLSTAVKGKHCPGCDLLTLGAAQICASPFIFPGKSEWGFHSSGRLSKFALFFDSKSSQGLWIHEWVTNVFFHLIYWNFPNSRVSPGEGL